MSGRFRSTLVALSTAITVLGVSVAILLMPWFTAADVALSESHQLTGLSKARTAELAQEVRYFVTHRGGELPAQVEGQPAFDAAAVSHLADVRDVVIAARWATVAALMILCVLVAHAVAHDAQLALARGFRWAGRALLGAIALLVFAGVADFEALFSAFHSLFFASGTWTFPYDAMIIRLFPLQFWTTSALALGALVVWGAVCFIIAGRAIARVWNAGTAG